MLLDNGKVGFTEGIEPYQAIPVFGQGKQIISFRVGEYRATRHKGSLSKTVVCENGVVR
jgi:hypothetical protein